MNDRYDYNYEKERREAIEAGQRALNSLRAAQKELESARNWGLVDLFGGGFISSMLKQGKMNTAQNHMEQARYDLQNFSKELRDVERGVDLHINTADFLTLQTGSLTGLRGAGWYRIESIGRENKWERQ